MPSTRAPSATASGVPPCRRCRGRSPRAPPATTPPSPRPRRATASTAPLRICAPVEVAAAHARLGRERHERRAQLARRRGRAGGTSPWPARRSSGPRASRRPGWRAARRRPAPRAGRPRRGISSVAMRLPSVIVPVLSSSSVSTSPAASTARPLIAITFLRSRRSMPAMPIADSRPPIVVGIRQTSSATITVADSAICAVERQRHQRHAGEQEDERQPDQQDVQRDLVGRLLARRALDQRDHPVEERLARVGGDAHDDAVGEHLGAAGDRRAVAAALADHRRRLAGDGRLVDRGDALDDLAVAGDQLAGLDDHQVALAQRRPRTRLLAPAVAQPARAWSPCASCAACRPGPCRGPRRPPRRSWRRAP